MKRKNTTRKALFTSILSLLLCVSMLVGTTFAWFTDSVTTGVNNIVAGNLDIELEYATPKDADGNTITAYGDLVWNPVDESTLLFEENVLWEPGFTQVVYLRIRNAGTLALKYNMVLNKAEETTGISVLGNEIVLSEILMVDMEESAIEEGETPELYPDREAATTDEWGAILEMMGMEPLHKSIAEKEGDFDAQLLPGEQVFVKIAVYMPTTVGNEANYVTGTTPPQIKLGLNLTATQLEYESDSFGPDYDKNVALVSTVAHLNSAIAEGKDVILTNDLVLDGPVAIPENTEIVINGNGYEITSADGRQFFNGTLANNLDGLGKNSKITVKNVHFVSNGGGYAAIVGPNDAGSMELTFDGCTFEDMWCGVYCGNVEATADVKLTIKNCTYINTVFGYSVDPNYTSNYTVTFENNSGYIQADEFVKSDDVVVVYNSEQLTAAVADGATNIYLMNGEYAIDGCGNKTLTISGTKNAVLIPTAGECPSDGAGVDTGFGNSTVTFNGVTIKSNGKDYSGWSYLTGVYNNCYFDGAYTTINYTHEFNNCTFKPNGYIWTWGATQIDFNDCEFVGDSRAILAHGSGKTVININNTTFAATEKGHTGSGDWTAAVEIHPTAGQKYTINFSNSTINENYSDWYRVKDGSTGHTVIVDGDDVVNTIKIGTKEELINFANDVNVNGNGYSGKTVILTADIDLEGVEWTPIGQTGSYSAKTYFQGTFDGKGHTISNLNVTVHETGTDGGANYASGLFGFIDGADANIRNLTVQNAKVSGSHWTGVIAGYLTGKIENCKVYNATVVCTHINGEACGDKAGVIAGMVQEADSYVKNCYVENSSVSAGRDAGVIIGCCNNATAVANSTGNTFSNVTVTANGTCTDDSAGEYIKVDVIGRIA